MSFGAVIAAMAVDLRCVDKMVLIALADFADDKQGDTAWPSMEQLANKSGLGVRATRQAVGALEAAGHISRQERPGKGVLYWVHPGTRCRPAQDAPRQDMPPPTPAPDAATPARDAANPLKNLSPPEPCGSAPKGAAPKPNRDDRSKRSRGVRLPADWHPEALPEPLAGVVAAKGASWLEAQLDKFRDWHAGQLGPKAFSADWGARWRVWIRDSLERSGGGTIEKTVQSMPEFQPVGDGDDDIRTALASEVGPAAYRAWFPNGSIFRDGPGFVVRTSPAAADHIRTEFLPQLRKVAARLKLDPAAIAIVAQSHPASHAR